MSLTPFSSKENSYKYELVKFKELDCELCFLNRTNDTKSLKKKSGNKYKFGVIYNHKYFWFFQGKIACNSRESMRLMWVELKKLCKENPDFELFVYKT